MTDAPAEEEVLEPDLPIVDPHHHLWDFRAGRPASPPAEGRTKHPFDDVVALSPLYLLDQLMADLNAGHNVRATVFVQCGAFYRAGVAPEMAPVGETEFVNGIAAMSASGLYGSARACAGIVGHAELALGDAVELVLEAHIRAGGGRFRGVRDIAAYDADPAVLGPLSRTKPGVYAGAKFREGFRRLGAMGLTLEAWILEPQLPDLVELVRAAPDTGVVLDHVGTPIGLGTYAGRRDERFGVWRDNIRELARSEQVMVKLGGLGMPFLGFEGQGPEHRVSSQALADAWRPYVETCIEAFGAGRCMFESNFPVDRWAADYRTLWNAFKRLASGASADEKHDLFAGTASRFYKLPPLS